jgi:DHA2 family multidrug resistance protein
VTAVATIVAPVLGPTLGGWITDNYSWRWIFLVNIPIGIMTFLGVFQLVQDPPWQKRLEGQKRRVYFIGISLIALGFGSLQLVMDRGEDLDWFGSNFIVGCAVVAAIGLSGAVVWLSSVKNPVVSMRVFANRNFAVGCIMIFAMAMVL